MLLIVASHFLSSKNKILFYNTINDHDKGNYMTEDNIAKEINRLIDKKGMTEIKINTFLSLWFKNKKPNDYIMTENFLRFSRTYGLDYVLILGPNNQILAIRFWKKEKEDEQKSIESGATREETTSPSTPTTKEAD